MKILTMMMLRSAMLTIAIASTLGPVQAQTVDTARVREAYNAATALRNDLERVHGRFATVNGIRLHYAEWGDAKGIPLVWVHGSGSFAYELRNVAPRLVQAGYRVLSVDSRGHGMTQVTDYDFGMSHIADDLIALLDHLKIPTAIFAQSRHIRMMLRGSARLLDSTILPANSLLRPQNEQ